MTRAGLTLIILMRSVWSKTLAGLMMAEAGGRAGCKITKEWAEDDGGTLVGQGTGGWPTAFAQV